MQNYASPVCFGWWSSFFPCNERFAYLMSLRKRTVIMLLYWWSDTVLWRQEKIKNVKDHELNMFHWHTAECEGKQSFEMETHRSKFCPSRLTHPEAAGLQHNQNHSSQEASVSIKCRWNPDHLFFLNVNKWCYPKFSWVC